MLVLTQLNGFGGKNGDPLYQFVELLLPFEGADGAMSTTDRSRDPKTVTLNADAQLDTAIKKHGSSSLLLDGTGDYASITDDAAFTLGTQSWTFEAWFYVTATSGNQTIFGIGTTGASNAEWQIRANGTSLQALVSSNGTAFDIMFASGGTISATTWHHAVLQRDGTSFTLALDGSSVATATSSASINHSGIDPEVGAVTGANLLTGNIDDLRWTIGAARYSFPYTPPGPLPAF